MLRAGAVCTPGYRPTDDYPMTIGQSRKLHTYRLHYTDGADYIYMFGRVCVCMCVCKTSVKGNKAMNLRGSKKGLGRTWRK